MYFNLKGKKKQKRSVLAGFLGAVTNQFMEPSVCVYIYAQRFLCHKTMHLILKVVS